MSRIARAQVFSPDEVAIVHVMNRVVRRCFLLGTDVVTGKNYDHRKVWIEELLNRQAASFGIDLLSFSILSNHFHLILRSRPDVVGAWDEAEVARRWLMLCPIRKTINGDPEEPNEMELNTIRDNPHKLETIRLRLSDIAWWMRLLCQHIAVRANQEDHEVGKFWQSRYRAVRLLDEQATLACAAYVDLNPIRAGMAKTLEQSDFTSVQRRIESLQSEIPSPEAQGDCLPKLAGAETPQEPRPVTARTSWADRFIAPLMLNEQSGELGPVMSVNGCRCSDKGFLPLPVSAYLELLDWTARELATGKRGSTPQSALPIFRRLSIDPAIWCELVGGFGRLFHNVAGHPQTVDATRSRIGSHRFHMRKQARELFATTE